MPRFSLFHSGRLERSFSVAGEVLTIGRLPGLEIKLETPTVSRQHGRIVHSGTDWILEDTGSVNGIYVGGQRVTRHALRPGDSIAIEDYTLVYEPPDEVYGSGQALTAGDEEASGRKTDPNITYLNISRFLPKE